MRKKNYKGRCEKRALAKCREICKTYDAIQSRYADMLQSNEIVIEFQCNVPLDGLDIGDCTTDFVCTLENDDLMVRECVARSHLTKPMTVKLLDSSRNYWLNHGVSDWGGGYQCRIMTCSGITMIFIVYWKSDRTAHLSLTAPGKQCHNGVNLHRSQILNMYRTGLTVAKWYYSV